MNSITFPIFCLILTACNAYQYESARIESCRGCSLNRLPEVKDFVLNDAPKYDRVDVKFIQGAPPELVLLGEGDREMERLPLSQLSRTECNELLKSKGFAKKSENTEF